MAIQKIFMLGIQGAGKTTLAEELSKNLELPAYYMDEIFYNSSWKIRPLDKIANEFKQICDTDKWIFDGFYSEGSDLFALNADLCISISSGRFRSYYNIFKRRVKSIFHSRVGTPEGSDNKLYFSFLKKVWKRNKNNEKQQLLEIQNKYDKLQIITIKKVNTKTIIKIIDILNVG